MKKQFVSLAGLVAVLAAGPVSAQQPQDLIRFEWISGFLLQGSSADAAFILDTTTFGGTLTERTDGTLDVDPSVMFGMKGTYRLSERVTLAASYLHSRGRYRVQFPALASIDGTFDLEGLILAGEDFINQGEVDVRAESAMSDALTDVYVASLQYEFPTLRNRAFPYFSVGGGLFTQKSDGNVIRLEYETNKPSRIELVENLGLNPISGSGLSVFSIDEKNMLLSFGAGIRVLLSDKWGADLQFENLLRMGVDLSDINASSTPPPDVTQGQFYSTTFTGAEGTVNSLGIRVALNYALWPFGAPR
ncbi:MAG: hypothetical protein HKN12_12055 [Gemmatimonadetes bacterium]|nr:hypothetical protein [Gemmatimonadota bacterium]